MDGLENEGLGGMACAEYHGEQGLKSLELTQKVKAIAISQILPHHHCAALSRTHKFHGLAC